MSRKRNRKHSVIDSLPDNQKDIVEQMLLAGRTYSEVVEYLAEHEVQLSISSVCRYARNMAEDAERLRIAQENFRVLTEEMRRYPDLDTTEAIIRLASQSVFRALASTPEEQWETVKPGELLRQANGLIKAAAYKNRLDIQSKTDTEAAMDSIKTMVFEAMSRERPELYQDVKAFLEQKGAEQHD